MKPQDIIFITVIILLTLSKKPKILTAAGILCLIFAIPLFHFWIFFTAQRLTEYAFFFILLASILLILKKR